MPELATRQEQMIRLDLEITRLKSENRSKAAQKTALADRVAKIDELAAQLKTRPAFLATQRSLDVAFVPYTQMSGVEPGAPVYSCLFGLFLCKDVGRVSDVVPGEVAMTDPWGNPSRGLYAVLNLTDRESAKSKTLRVRATQIPGIEKTVRTTNAPGSPGGRHCRRQVDRTGRRVETPHGSLRLERSHGGRIRPSPTPSRRCSSVLLLFCWDYPVLLSSTEPHSGRSVPSAVIETRARRRFRCWSSFPRYSGSETNCRA